MTDTDTDATGLRVISTEELARVVTVLRQAMKWTQETLAEISDLTVRTVQRVEKGQASSADTRRALARAFKIEDIDTFNKPQAFKSAEQLKAEVEELRRSHMTLPVTIARTGKALAEFAELANMRCFTQPDDVPRDVAECVSGIYDFLADYVEVYGLYSYTQKLGEHAVLDYQVTRLRSLGYSVCFALRKTSIVGKDWKDGTPLPVGVAYAFVAKRGAEPTCMLVPTKLEIGF